MIFSVHLFSKILLFNLLLLSKANDCNYKLCTKFKNCLDGQAQLFKEEIYLQCQNLNLTIRFYNFTFESNTSYDFNRFNYLSQIRIEESKLDQLIKAEQILELKNYTIKKCLLTKLDRNDYIPEKILNLDFSSNLIDQIRPDFFSKFFNLISLNLSDNKLKQIQSLNFNSLVLEYLDMSKNILEFIYELNLKQSSMIQIKLESNYNLKQLPSISANSNIIIDQLDFKNQSNLNLLFLDSLQKSKYKSISINRINISSSWFKTDRNLLMCFLNFFQVKKFSIDFKLNLNDTKNLTYCDKYNSLSLGESRLNEQSFMTQNSTKNDKKCTRYIFKKEDDYYDYKEIIGGFNLVFVIFIILLFINLKIKSLKNSENKFYY
ncbi:unnamed protein product [Brachionus calyciflorus]|uniref:Transmembrane protein n=1 Tax=Brachionus calyciflorus TaxID=104777 RepID=A0A814N6J6_9BILA|nr:unnamed protein product [Brachionus calyciflorus]